MIRVITTDETFNIPGTATDVDTSAGDLKVSRDGQVIAQFRRWLSWHEADEDTQGKA